MEEKIPLYYKVYNYLLTRIKEECRPGDLLPTQSEIARETDTSLITVKRAIKELEAEGLIESRAGKGTTVKKPQIIDSHVGVSSWTDSITAQGGIPSTAWTKIEQREPSSSVANVLGLKARSKTVNIERLRMIDDRPICIMTNKIPMDLVPGLNNNVVLNESLYTFLKEQYDLVGASAGEEVSARIATDYEIKLLQLKTPIVLVIERTSYLLNDVPFEMSSIVASADSYVYRSKQVNKTLGTKDLKKVLISA